MAAHPHHGFRAFFKTDANIPLIRNVLQAIAIGKNLTTGKPMIECFTPNSPTYCFACSVTPSQDLAATAAAFPEHGLVALCPLFWTLPTFPTLQSCPAVIGRRGHLHFADDGFAFVYTKFGTLLQELVHLYNPLDAGGEEVYTAQASIELAARKCLGNAANWAFYASAVVADDHTPVHRRKSWRQH